MKKKIKVLSLLLALVLMLSVFTACSSEAEPETSGAATESQSVESAPAPEETNTVLPQTIESTPAPSDEAAPTSEAAPEPEPSEEEPVEEPKKVIEYPLTDPSDPYVITIWAEFHSLFEQYISSFNELPLLPAILERTGVDYQFVEVSQTIATERFNLMIVSDDWTDIIRASDYYTGGLPAAYNDGVILDLTDMIPEYAPDYYDALMNTNQDTIDMIVTAGRHLQMTAVESTTLSDRGMVVRGDWLETLGLDIPTNLQEFTDALYAIHAEYDTPKSFYLRYDGAISYVNNAFGMAGINVSGNATSISMTRDGDVLSSSLVSDGTKAYIEWFNKLYNDGIFQDDFYTNVDNDNEITANVAKGEAGFWTGAADGMDQLVAATDDPSFKQTPVGRLYDADGNFTYGNVTTMANNKGFSVTQNCEYPEIAVSFFNYFFTDEGMLLANYGLEGDTFEYDENGKPQYTDAILNDPDYFAPFMAIVVKCFTQAPTYNDTTKLMNTYSDAAIEAIEVWTDKTNVTVEHNIPNGASLTADQTNEIATTLTDIIAYTSEALLGFMTASAPPTDDEWNQYVQQCETLGLSRCVNVYQQAYDDYLELQANLGN